MLNEVNEGCPFDFHWLSMAVVEGQNKMEEVGLSQVGRRLFLKVGTRQSYSTVDTITLHEFTLNLQASNWINSMLIIMTDLFWVCIYYFFACGRWSIRGPRILKYPKHDYKT